MINVDLAIFLEFALVIKEKIWITSLGKAFVYASENEQFNIIRNQLLRTKIVNVFVEICKNKDRVDTEQILLD